MITDLTYATFRSLASRPLKRGRACMNCRFHKIKCDGHKPIYGLCRKHLKDDECECSDTIQRLRARLHELEHPEDSITKTGDTCQALMRVTGPDRAYQAI
ncbi:hypothetical protein B0H19DRAFT_479930 [Mycena capillaripes]|nr:hypothetical protein B0H19DRAFT_479930 [Mycena capillaripes]